MQSFDPLDDSSHLRIGVLLVRLAPCCFGEVDVEPLCLLRVVVVAGTEVLEAKAVVTEMMKFR